MMTNKTPNDNNEHAGRSTQPGEFDKTIARDAQDSGGGKAGSIDGKFSVLKSFEKTIDSVPRVVLRDENAKDNQPPVVRESAESPSSKSDSRYHVGSEIARGGMGAILKGRDNDLGRDLAIKVSLADFKDTPDVVSRFIEEAQIGGQLQHPGIAPSTNWENFLINALSSA